MCVLSPTLWGRESLQGLNQTSFQGHGRNGTDKGLGFELFGETLDRVHSF